MPQQAILDLPILEFEAFNDAPQSLHKHCESIYGISGVTPHADAALHLGASLWRYREAESPKQVAGLAACYLTALSDHVAARRRFEAARASTRSLKRVRNAEEELDETAHHLDEVTRVIAEFVGVMIETADHDSARARRRLESNLRAMGEAGWAAEMEQSAAGFIAGKPRVRWTDSLIDVLDALEGAHVPGSGNGHNRVAKLEGRVIEQLERELDEYRELATTASARLRQVDHERRELEQLLAHTETGVAERAIELDEARGALEHSLAAARDRLTKLEHDIDPEARDELRRVRLERDKLAEELLNALSAATDSEVSREEALDHLEQAATDRVQAAQAIGSLSTRLDALQRDAETSAERSEAYRQRMNELEDDRNTLRADLAAAEQQHQQDLATIETLEKAERRSTEYKQRLKGAETRLAEAEAALEDVRLKNRALTSELDDTLSELEKTRDKLARQLTDLERAGRKLAEAETLANDRNARNLQLAREYEGLNDRLRQELERAADAVSAKEKAEHALAELQPHLDELRESRNQLTGRLKALEGSAAEATRSMQQRDTATGRLKDELSDARKRIQELEAALASAQSDLAANGDDATDAGAREQADALRGQLVAAQAEREMLQQQAIELQEAQRSAADLAEDRMRKLQERLELMAERTRRQDDERKLLMDALSRQEQGRVDEKSELELVAQRADKELGAAQRRVQESQDQVRALHDKLNEAESFLIARQRDLEKAEARLKEMKEAIGTVADLRAEYEATNAEGQRAKIASQISRKLDTLFAEVGRPIHADRKTEKILILHVKKSDDEIEEEKPFVATKRRGKAGPASAGGNDRAQSKRS